MNPFLLDALVLAAYFAAIMGIGLYSSRGQSSLQDYALGGRSIPWWAVLASILAAEISAATFLGAPGEGYELRNFTYAQLALGTILARVLVSWIFIKPYYTYRVVSIYEFLEIRFGPTTRQAASGIFLITRALASGTRLYVAAIILVLGYEMVTGTRPTQSQELIITFASLLFLVALTAVYTAMGGIKAVVWTDLIQSVVMFSGLGFVLWHLAHSIPGGWDGFHAKLQQPGDLSVWSLGQIHQGSLFANLKSVLESEYTLWTAFFAATFVTMATHGTDQDMVQRMLTAKNPARSRLALVASGLADIPIVMAFLTIGILLWVHYQYSPNPHLPERNAHIFAFYILEELPPGLRGLLIAGIFATTMGSLSTALNALATSWVRDWYEPFLAPRFKSPNSLRAARWSTVAFSGILVLIGAGTAWMVITNPTSRILPIVLGIFGYTYGSLLGVFLLGALTKNRGCDRGNLFAMATGFLVVAILSGLPSDLLKLCGLPPLPRPDWLPLIAFPWRITFGTLTTFLIALLFCSSKPIPSPQERTSPS
jgi:SSS family transporter